MNANQKRHLGKTHVSQVAPWGLYTRNGHRLLCADGKIRAAELSEAADTFFSVPARVRVGRKWISGYMTIETAYSEDCTEERSAYAFRHHDIHAGALPAWPGTFTPEHWAVLEGGAG